MILDDIKKAVSLSLSSIRCHILECDNPHNGGVLHYINKIALPKLLDELERHNEVLSYTRGTSENAEIRTVEGTFLIQFNCDSECIPSCVIQQPNGVVMVTEFPREFITYS